LQGAAGFLPEVLRNFDENIVYEDLNFAVPFVGRKAVAGFLEEFDIPGVTFIPGRISVGRCRLTP
jgi:hypothetical protein